MLVDLANYVLFCFVLFCFFFFFFFFFDTICFVCVCVCVFVDELLSTLISNSSLVSIAEMQVLLQEFKFKVETFYSSAH